MPYKDRDRQREAQRDWVRQKRAKKVRQGQGSTEGSTNKSEGLIDVKTLAALDAGCGANLNHGMAERIAPVRPGNGTEQDGVRAASDRLLAALGGPVVTVVRCRYCDLSTDQASPQCNRH